jgi:flagellar motor switch protein FliM
MSNIDYPVYDFLTASKVERPLAKALQVWLDKFAKTFVDRWKEFAPSEIVVTPLAIDSVTFEAAQAKWVEPAVGVPIDVNTGTVHGMIVASRSDLLILLMEILCETLTERPADRELTTVEGSLCQLLFEQSVATFGEAWPDKEVLPVTMAELEWQPNRSRLLPPSSEVLTTGFSFQTASSEAGPSRIEWVFDKSEMKQLLGVESTSEATVSDATKITSESISKLMVDVSASLGTTELDMSDLISLESGDIVKLSQRIQSPLILQVNDQPVFEAWPGRNGEKQCFQVESVIS